MAYVHCMPARVASLRHNMNNIVEGTLRTPDGDMPFRTRGHVVKATNKIYRNCIWKPSAGDAVLFDGEISGGSITVDHIERDLGAESDQASTSPHLDAIAALLPTHPPATKALRVCRANGLVRVRFATCASRRDARGKIQEEVVHAIHDHGRWTLWTVRKDGGTLAASGLDAAVMTIVGRAAGADLLFGETEREKSDREEALQREEARNERAARAAQKPQPAPFDDCPF